MLQQPTNPLEFVEVRQLRLGTIGALVRARPPGAAQAGCAVVLCPGHPRNTSAASFLISSLDKALGSAGVPAVRFDYEGVGLSSATLTNNSADGQDGSDVASRMRKKTQQVAAPPFRQAADETDLLAACVRNLRKIVTWAKTHLSSHVVVCGYSHGSIVAQRLARDGETCGYISISGGFAAHLYREGSEAARLKSYTDEHMGLTCPCLYILGDRDRSTPLDVVEQLVKGRSDGGSDVSIAVVRKGSHEMRDKGPEVGKLCVAWIRSLQETLPDVPLNASLVAESAGAGDDYDEEGDQRIMFDQDGDVLGVVDVDNIIRAGCEVSGCPAFKPPTIGQAHEILRTCLHCGYPNTAHMDKGLCDDKENFVTIHITCQKTSSQKSRGRIFHLELPLEADVGELRACLGSDLPKNAQILSAQGPHGTPAALEDSDALPGRVVLSEFVGTIEYDMILTGAQCQEFMVRIKRILRRPDIQRQLDELENTVYRSDPAFIEKADAMRDQVYVQVGREFGLEESSTGVKLPLLLSQVVRTHAENNLELLQDLLDVASIIRSTEMAALVHVALCLALQNKYS